MVSNLLKKVFGSRNERLLKRMSRTVKQINAYSEEMAALEDAALRARTEQFRERLAKGEKLDDLLPEAFAVVRETSVRTLGMRHFDVQLVGAMALHDGHIAEMRTGEGKTLVATLPAYLNALTGNGVHIVTVNDYLARRDAEWMGRIYEFLGMSVGVVVPGQTPDEKRAAYAADITYGTNNEFGFDYLRDNMAFAANERMQRGQHYAIVDEVDSILIDEARTPLIISGPTSETSELYVEVNKLVPQLTRQQEEDGPGDFSVDEKTRQVALTEDGHIKAEGMLEEAGLLAAGESLYDAANIVLMHHLYASLRAHSLFQKDVHYIVREGEVVIVDEFTGRTMPGRRWSEGLHQAVEAKEGLRIQNENQTLASITFQNYFRLFGKLAGMTGTADTEAAEFQQIYGLEVVLIPTHRPMVRDDLPDLVFLTKHEKFDAIIEDIEDCQQRSQPVLVGTASIEASEYLADLLTKKGVQHEVLNAKQHAREALIVQHAGRPGVITIATNMAGRGTDIVLGGNLQTELAEVPEDDEPARRAVQEDWQKRHDAVIAAGGLHIVGSERHESRRIDNQLRGRSGRQGDPGSSRFYLSLEDDLMRIFASERVANMMKRLGMQQGEAIEHRMVTRAIENAQKKVEGRNFDIRKQLLEYDDVANDQRKEIYALRNELMDEEDVSERIAAIRDDVVDEIIDRHIPRGSLDELWDIPGLMEALEKDLGAKLDIANWLESDDTLHEETLRARIHQAINDAYQQKEQLAGAEVLRHFEKAVMLQLLDSAWKEHLASMDYLRQGIGLRGFAQKNPKQEYKREAFEMFHSLLERIKHDVTGVLCRVQVRAREDVEAVEEQRRQTAPVNYSHAPLPSMAEAAEAGADELPAAAAGGGAVPAPGGPPPASRPAPASSVAGRQSAAGGTPFVREGRKIGRNEPCPCGSGKKYKQCHGRLD